MDDIFTQIWSVISLSALISAIVSSAVSAAINHYIYKKQQNRAITLDLIQNNINTLSSINMSNIFIF